jgi:hypothetical protein
MGLFEIFGFLGLLHDWEDTGIKDKHGTEVARE